MKKIWKVTDDERLMAESGKIYRIGFWVLAAGVLLDLLVKTATYLPAWVGEEGIFPLMGLETLVLLAALLLCALLAAGRGILTVGATRRQIGFLPNTTPWCLWELGWGSVWRACCCGLCFTQAGNMTCGRWCWFLAF